MDSLTHIAIGACLGEAVLGRRLGKKSIVWGIVAHSMPDIDFISSVWLSTVDHLLAHRGLTHSLAFVLLATLLLSFLADRIHKKKSISVFSWIIFFGICLTGHILLDMCNSYGVGLLEPLNHQRFSPNIIYVADPFFSASVGFALLGLLLLNAQHKLRKFFWVFGLSISPLYFSYCLYNKMTIEKKVELSLSRQKLDFKRIYTAPAPLQNWLWFIIIEDGSGYFVKYISVFDSQAPVFENYFPKNDLLSNQVSNKIDLDKLIRFSEKAMY